VSEIPARVFENPARVFDGRYLALNVIAKLPAMAD